jgi:hypothetical protein
VLSKFGTKDLNRDDNGGGGAVDAVDREDGGSDHDGRDDAL